MKKAFIAICIACLIAASSGCASSSKQGVSASQQGVATQNAGQTTQTKTADISLEHYLINAAPFPLYSFPDFDLKVGDRLKSWGGLTVSRAASQLVKLIREREKYSGQMFVELVSSEAQNVDNSTAFYFVVRWADKEKTYYVTEWAKVFDKALQYVGRIEKGDPEPGVVLTPPEMETIEYVDYYFTFPKEIAKIDGLSVEEAAEFVAHQAIAELFPNLGCTAWSIVLSGISEIDGQKAYDFSIYHEWFGSLDDGFSYFFWGRSSTPVLFRMAVTADRKAYLYDKEPQQVGKLAQLPLSDEQPLDPELAATLKKVESYATMLVGKLGGVKLPEEFNEQFSYTQYPNYKIKFETKPGENERKWVLNAAENLYQWFLSRDFPRYNVLQTIDNGTFSFKLAVNSSSTTLSEHYSHVIVYKGKRVVDGKTQHYFDLGRVNVENLNEEKTVSMMVQDDGTIYEYRAAMRLYKALPQSIEPGRIKQLDDALLHDYAPTRDKDGRSSRFCNGTYNGMNFKKDENDDDSLSLEAANYIFDHIDEFYHGERNLNPWCITELEGGEIDGAKTHEFAVGQGNSKSYPIYFRTAVTETGKVYYYDGKEPIYFSTLSGMSETAQDEKSQEGSDQRSKTDIVSKGDQMEDEAEEVAETKKSAREEREKNAGLAPKQNVDELKAFYADKGFRVPKIASQTVKGKVYFDFDLVYANNNIPQLKGIKHEIAASYIDQALIPKLNRTQPLPWKLLLNSKERIDALNKEALFFALGSVDDNDKFSPSEYYIVSEDKLVYSTQVVPKYIMDMPVQSSDSLQDYETSMSYSFSGVMMNIRNYPRFKVEMPLFENTIENYPIEQAAAEVEAAYLRDHNDGNWIMRNASIIDFDGVKAWKFVVSYEYNTLPFDVIATADHKLYRYTRELKQVGAIPKKQAEASKDPVPEDERSISSAEKSCGNGTYNVQVHGISQGDYVSLSQACHWVIETLGKTYTERNNNPWRLVLTQITKVDGVDGYEFDVGQGKYKLDKTLFKAIVTQDRKIYKVGNKPEFAGTIPEDAPEPITEKSGNNYLQYVYESGSVFY